MLLLTKAVVASTGPLKAGKSNSIHKCQITGSASVGHRLHHVSIVTYQQKCVSVERGLEEAHVQWG